MNNYFIIGKVNEGKSHLFNLFSINHKTISNPKENTTVDIIRKKILYNNYNYFLFDTPGFYNLKEFTLLNNRIKSLKLNNVTFIYLAKNLIEEDLKICKFLYSIKNKVYLFSFKKISEKNIISNLFEEKFINFDDNLTSLKKYLIDINQIQLDNNLNINNQKTVAIFGKENTGKSTLFNKITNISLSKTSHNYIPLEIQLIGMCVIEMRLLVL